MFERSFILSEKYYDRSSNWVFDRGSGQYLYSRRSRHNPNIIREGYFYSNQKQLDEEEYIYYEQQKEKQKSQLSEKSSEEI